MQGRLTGKRVSDRRLYAGNVITPQTRREFVEKQAELYKQQYLKTNKDKEETLSESELEKVAFDYGKHMANKEVKHFKAFLKGREMYKYGRLTFPVLTKESIKNVSRAEDIIKINKVEEEE